MCFKRNSTRTLLLRSFKNLNGNYSIGINKKKVDQVLVVDLKINDGSIDLVLINELTDAKQIKESAKTGIYEFEIKNNNKYRFILSSRHASGSYSVHIMPKL